jgi:hypothetical protein
MSQLKSQPSRKSPEHVDHLRLIVIRAYLYQEGYYVTFSIPPCDRKDWTRLEASQLLCAPIFQSLPEIETDQL